MTCNLPPPCELFRDRRRPLTRHGLQTIGEKKNIFNEYASKKSKVEREDNRIARWVRSASRSRTSHRNGHVRFCGNLLSAELGSNLRIKSNKEFMELLEEKGDQLSSRTKIREAAALLTDDPRFLAVADEVRHCLSLAFPLPLFFKTVPSLATLQRDREDLLSDFTKDLQKKERAAARQKRTAGDTPTALQLQHSMLRTLPKL